MNQSASTVSTTSSAREVFTLRVAHACDSFSNITIGQHLKTYIAQHFQGWERERLYPLANALKAEMYKVLKAEYREEMIDLFNTLPLDAQLEQKIMDLHKATVEKLTPAIVDKVVAEFLAYIMVSPDSTKVYTESKYQMLPDNKLELVSEKSFKYSGPIAKCLRAEESMAKNAAKTAATTAAGLGQTAAGELSKVQPFYQNEMQQEHAYDPTQINELLTAAGAGIGGAAGASQGALDRQAASSGNAAGATKSLQEMARDRMKAGAGVSEGVAGQDVQGALQMRQQGAAGEAGLYGENTKGMLDAMGQEAGDINAATNASQHGWLQNAEGVVNTVANAATGAANLKKAFS